MTTKRSGHSRNDLETDQDKRMRPAVIWTVAGLLVLCLVGAIWHFLASSTEPPAPSPQRGNKTLFGANRPQAGTNGAAAKSPVESQVASAEGLEKAAGTNLPFATNAPSPAAGQPAPVDPVLTALVAGLKTLDMTNGMLSAEAAGAWKTNFVQLVQSGAAAIPALKAFLDQKADVAFNQATWQALGYGSARLAALDALRQIGGPEAVAVMQNVLSSTQAPREVAVLARNLEEAAPGEYREQALAATRAGLKAAATAKDPQLDVAPLFEVFQHYGDASVIPDLEQSLGQWKYYATMALANLPDGAGIPTILQQADPGSTSGNRTLALEMVAQFAATNVDARRFLANQVANNTIPPNLWPYLQSPLAGDQYYPVDSAITSYPQLQASSDLKTAHITYGNQNLYTLPGEQSLTGEGISQRLALVEELLRSATDPAALKALQQAKETLSKRSARSPAGTGPGTGTNP